MLFDNTKCGDSPVAGRRSPIAGHLPRRLAVGNELMLRPTTLSIVLLLAWTVARYALQTNNRRISSYKSRAKLLLEFSSVLNLNRNVWIACWRSSPVAASCRRPRRFGSVQQTPVACRGTQFAGVLICCVVTFGTDTSVRQFDGVPICCVERWNLIRWLAGRRYAASAVYQSVVLVRTLKSDTATRRSLVAGIPSLFCRNIGSCYFAGVFICCFGTLEVWSSKPESSRWTKRILPVAVLSAYRTDFRTSYS